MRSRPPSANSSCSACPIADVANDHLPLAHRALNLSRNVIRGPGVAPLVNVIPLNQTLTHLDLSYNGLGDAGVCSLVRTLSGIWAEDPVRMKVHFLGLAGTRMGTRATLAVATLLAGMAGTLSEFADGASGLPPAFPPSWTFEIDISDHDLSGVAPVVLARQLRKLADLPQHRDGGRVVSVLHNHVTTTCLNRQAKLPGEVARGEEELRELVGEPAKGKGSKKGKGKKKGKVREGREREGKGRRWCMRDADCGYAAFYQE